MENNNMKSLYITFKHIGPKMETVQEDLLNSVTNVLGLSFRKWEVLSDYVYYTISIIIHWKYKKADCIDESKLDY